jgi:hypothetical protein
LKKSTVNGDAKQAIGILAWAQEAGLHVSSVTVGACHVEIGRAAAPAEREERPAVESIYGRFGGPALAHIEDVQGVDLQPVIGRQAR